MPGEDVDHYQIIYMNLDDNEKEDLFDMLDENLHDKAYGQLYRECDYLRCEVERLKNLISTED